jgi:SNF2 family DNA or RNA helicase
MVVCPTTLIGNWEKECARFASALNVSIYHGNERRLELKDVDLLITSYGVFRRDLEKFSTRNWDFLIVDEAQNIKNSETAQTKAIKSLKAKTLIAMTGTPVENRLTELWNIFDFINPGYMGSLTHFKTELANPIERARDAQAIEKLKRATAPFLLRRLKTDKSIITDLPDKLTSDEYCYLTKAQAAIYQNVVDSIMKDIQSSDGIERKGLIFKLIMALKQICNHPAHYSNQGSVASDLSGKAAKTITTLKTILENGEKALIFTQYREMGELLLQMIQDELGTEALFFHGGLTRKKRDEMVQAFQEDRHTRLMILSLKAGGTGLNLTAASNVIHYDLWWNPAVENQATDRAYRIGQGRNVLVHRLITLGTFEEKIDEMIKAKQALANLTVATGESWISEMSNQQLKEIFNLSLSG